MIRTSWQATRANARALFQRPNNNFAAIDGIRAFSLLAVMLYHCFFLIRSPSNSAYFTSFVQETPWYLGWVWSLDYSVDAFFVISGYLIATLLFREHIKTGSIDLKRFYWRRYLRLTPAYFAFILLVVIAAPKAVSSIWANLLYVNNFLPLKEMSLPWTWSLAVEEQFYLLFPALILWFVLKGSRPLLKLVALLVASQLCTLWFFASDEKLWQASNLDIFFDWEMFNHYYDRFYVNLYTRFGPFVSGGLVAYLLIYHRDAMDNVRANRMLFNGINLIVLGFMAYVLGLNPYASESSLAANRWHLIVDRNLFGIALSWIIFAVHGPAGILQPLKGLLSWKCWYPIAQLSYCMYLLHYIVVLAMLAYLQAQLRHFGLLESAMAFPYYWILLTYIGVIVLTMVPATLLHLAVEKPFMQLRDSLERRRASRTAAALPSGARSN